jgi:hypothetical protein
VARVSDALGVGPGEAQDHVAAHTAGATGPGGAAAARVLRRVAQHHAGVWIDAFQIACSKLAADRSLPPRVLLCGGGAGLPELRRSLAEPTWQVGLPFDLPPAVRLLSPADVSQVEVRRSAVPALQAVPLLCVAALAGGAIGPPTRLDALLRQRRGRGETPAATRR